MEEIVIQRVYSILLSCCKKYDMKGLEQCMYNHVRDVVAKGMDIVRHNPSQKEKNKQRITKLVTDSLMRCAFSSYEVHHSEQRVQETVKCIQENVDGLINMSVDVMTTMITLNQYFGNMLRS